MQQEGSDSSDTENGELANEVDRPLSPQEPQLRLHLVSVYDILLQLTDVWIELIFKDLIQ